MVEQPPVNGAAIRELQRRMEKLEQRFEWLDEHGSRAVGMVAYQMTELSKDIGRLEEMVKILGASVEKSAGVKWQQILTLCVAVLPLYILTITILVNNVH